MENHEERLIRLEELTFFQEERLEALNAALTAQQRQLDAVEQQLAEAVDMLRALRGQMELLKAGAPGSVEELPPHYMPERYSSIWHYPHFCVGKGNPSARARGFSLPHAPSLPQRAFSEGQEYPPPGFFQIVL